MANGTIDPLEPLRRTSTPAIIDINRIEFEDIREIFVRMISEREELGAFLEADTVVFLIDAMAALGAYTQYSIDAAWLESNLHTAISPAAVRAIVRTLGVRQRRKTPAHMQVRITQPTHRNALIPAYSTMSVDGVSYFTRDPVRVFRVFKYDLGLASTASNIYGVTVSGSSFFVSYNLDSAAYIAEYGLSDGVRIGEGDAYRIPSVKELRGITFLTGRRIVAIHHFDADRVARSDISITALADTTRATISTTAGDFSVFAIIGAAVTITGSTSANNDDFVVESVADDGLSMTLVRSSGAFVDESSSDGIAIDMSAGSNLLYITLPALGTSVDPVVVYNTLRSENTNPRDIAIDDDRFLVVDASGTVFEYDKKADPSNGDDTYSDVSGSESATFDVSSLTPSVLYPQGITVDSSDSTNIRVLVSDRNGYIWQLNDRLSTARRLYRLPSAPRSLQSAANDALLALAENGDLTAFDRNTGAPGRKDTRGFEVTVYEGEIRRFRDTAVSSADYATVVLPEGDFQASDLDVAASVNGAPIHVSRLPIWLHGERSPIPDAVQDFTLSQGHCEIRFGSQLFGRLLSAGDVVDVQYAITSGARVNGTDVLGKKPAFSTALAQQLPGATGEVVTVIGGGRDETSADVYRITAPHIFGAQNTATRHDGYRATALDFDGVLDCLAIRHSDYAPQVVEYSNLIKLWVLADDPNHDGNDLVITATYKNAFNKFMLRFGLASARYVILTPSKKDLHVDIDVEVLSAGDRSTIERNVKNAIMNRLKILPGIIGKTVARDALASAAKDSHPSISGVNLTYLADVNPEGSDDIAVSDFYTSFAVPYGIKRVAETNGKLDAGTYRYAGTITTEFRDENGESRMFRVGDVVLTAEGSVRLSMTLRFGDRLRIYRQLVEEDGSNLFAYLGESPKVGQRTTSRQWTVDGQNVIFTDIGPSAQLYDISKSDGTLTTKGPAQPLGEGSWQGASLAWDSTSPGTLFGWAIDDNDNTASLYSIDRMTDISEATIIGRLEDKGSSSLPSALTSEQSLWQGGGAAKVGSDLLGLAINNELDRVYLYIIDEADGSLTPDAPSSARLGAISSDDISVVASTRTISTVAGSFSIFNVGDIIVINGFDSSGNNGEFRIDWIATNGRSMTLENPDSVLVDDTNTGNDTITIYAPRSWRSADMARAGTNLYVWAVSVKTDSDGATTSSAQLHSVQTTGSPPSISSIMALGPPQDLDNGSWLASGLAWDGTTLFGWAINNDDNTARLCSIDSTDGALTPRGVDQQLPDGYWSAAGMEWDGSNLLGWLVDSPPYVLKNVPQESALAPAGVESAHVFYPSIDADSIEVNIEAVDR